SKNYQRSVPGQAMSLAEQSQQLRQELAARFPDDRELAWDLSLSYELVGDLARATSLPRARELFDKALAIRQSLREAEPNNDEWYDGLSKILVRIGDIDVREKKFEKAFGRYDRALGLSIDLHLRQPESERWQRELSWTLNKSGDLLLDRGLPAKA